MAEVTINNSPVHSDTIITRPYGYIDSSYSCGWHTGLDFARYGETSTNPDIFSVSEGTVIQTINSNSEALGTQVLIQDSEGKYWRYCHMVLGSISVSVGQIVNTGTKLGNMGATGNVTGIHLHLEYSSTSSWQCSTFLNPATKLGIPNVTGTIVHFDGTVPPIPPEPPVPSDKKNSKKWAWHNLTKKIIIRM